eukprot:6200936-Pleurochrysis_carterae.AAC.2
MNVRRLSGSAALEPLKSTSDEQKKERQRRHAEAVRDVAQFEDDAHENRACAVSKTRQNLNSKSC